MTSDDIILIRTMTNICRSFKLTPGEVRAKSRKRKYAYPRFIYCANVEKINPKKISKRLRVHRTTIYHAQKVCKEVFELRELFSKFIMKIACYMCFNTSRLK